MPRPQRLATAAELHHAMFVSLAAGFTLGAVFGFLARR